MYLLPAGELESGELCEQDLLEEEDGMLLRRYLLSGQRIFLGTSVNKEFCPLWQPLLDSAGAKVRVKPRTGELIELYFILIHQFKAEEFFFVSWIPLGMVFVISEHTLKPGIYLCMFVYVKNLVLGEWPRRLCLEDLL